jgi:hypothetical protein
MCNVCKILEILPAQMTETELGTTLARVCASFLTTQSDEERFSFFMALYLATEEALRLHQPTPKH